MKSIEKVQIAGFNIYYCPIIPDCREAARFAESRRVGRNDAGLYIQNSVKTKIFSERRGKAVGGKYQ